MLDHAGAVTRDEQLLNTRLRMRETLSGKSIRFLAFHFPKRTGCFRRLPDLRLERTEWPLFTQ
ncbi:hypothetical protein CIW48_20770 [Methylobacterium sp. P1-11]|nr:hypothetical protein CIW48_20770 [Methylobacterium sp. P1-11]